MIPQKPHAIHQKLKSYLHNPIISTIDKKQEL